jgi:hypothetical protein
MQTVTLPLAMASEFQMARIQSNLLLTFVIFHLVQARAKAVVALVKV